MSQKCAWASWSCGTSVDGNVQGGGTISFRSWQQYNSWQQSLHPIRRLWAKPVVGMGVSHFQSVPRRKHGFPTILVSTPHGENSLCLGHRKTVLEMRSPLFRIIKYVPRVRTVSEKIFWFVGDSYLCSDAGACQLMCGGRDNIKQFLQTLCGNGGP
jgi:hypothetical protein